MENSRQTLNTEKSADQALHIIRHPSYQPCTKLSLQWFDIRVFYVRISNFIVDDSTPDCLTLNHIPLSHETLLEVNGKQCKMYSEGVSCLLRRDRVDKKSEEATFVSTDNIRVTGSKKSEEATFVSTDNIRVTGSMKFDVFYKDVFLLSGVLEIPNSNDFVSEPKNNTKRWSINCESAMTAGTGFFKGKQVMGGDSLSPTIEVYVAGCCSGTPIILTKTLQLNFPKKHYRKGALDSIPEYEATECQKNVSSGLDLQVAEYRNYKTESEEEDYNNLYWRTEYMEGEDWGELSWFNAGVRVGVGIGLGICVGIGVGVGLLVRTYHATSRNFKRRLI